MKVAIISDYAMMRSSLRTLVQAVGGVVVLETRASEPLPTEAHWGQSDLAVLDTDTTPLELSLEICKRVAEQFDSPPLVAVQSPGSRLDLPERFLSTGAFACAHLAPSAVHLAAVRCAGHSAHAISDTCGFSPDAGSRDVAILHGVAQGLHDWEIGVAVGYDADYVKHRIEAIMRQNGLRGRAQLGMWMRDQGYVLLARQPRRKRG